MTTYLVRTDLTTSVTEPDDVRLLDWAPARPAATIQTGDTQGVGKVIEPGL